MYNFITKFVALALVLGLNMPGVLAVQTAFAYFDDIEVADSNSFETSVLNFSVPDTLDFSPNVMPSAPDACRSIEVDNIGSLPIEYKIKIQNVSGDLCSELILKAELDGDVRYNASIFEGSIFPTVPPLLVTLGPGGQDDWDFTASLTSGYSTSSQGDVCDFDLVFDGWQIGGVGFSDEERISNRVEAAPVVLNEFLPNAVDYPEYIEIFNMTSSSVNLDGFYIETKDGAGGNVKIIPINVATTEDYTNNSSNTTTILANSWLVVVPKPEDNWIDNTSGTITLFNSNHVVVDAYTYGPPDHNINNNPGVTNNLVGYWSFDGSIPDGGTVEDLSGNGNDGVNNGAVSAAGRINEGLNFDGSDYVGVADSSSFHTISDEITMEVWVKVASNKNYNSIIVKDADGAEDFELLCNSGGDCYSTFDGVSSRFYKLVDTNLQPGVWTHLAVTYKNGGDWVFYKDGLSIDTTSGTQALKIDSGAALRIGDEIGTTGRKFDGIIDEVKIYNRALSDDEIGKHFNDVSIPPPDPNNAVPVDKSYARIPDGIGEWIDPIPTIGGPNRLSVAEMNAVDVAVEPVEIVEPVVEEIIDEKIEELPVDPMNEVVFAEALDGGQEFALDENGDIIENEDVEDVENAEILEPVIVDDDSDLIATGGDTTDIVIEDEEVPADDAEVLANEEAPADEVPADDEIPADDGTPAEEISADSHSEHIGEESLPAVDEAPAEQPEPTEPIEPVELVEAPVEEAPVEELPVDAPAPEPAPEPVVEPEPALEPEPVVIDPEPIPEPVEPTSGDSE